MLIDVYATNTGVQFRNDQCELSYDKLMSLRLCHRRLPTLEGIN